MPHPIREILEAPKTLLRAPVWIPDGVYRRIVAPLAVDGVALEGLQIRGWYRPQRPERDVMLQLELQPAAGKQCPIERIDWRPSHKHSNNRERGGIPLGQFSGSHVHEFELNYFESESRMLSGNLRYARPLATEVNDFQNLLAFAESRFRVNGLSDKWPSPEWEHTLFG